MVAEPNVLDEPLSPQSSPVRVEHRMVSPGQASKWLREYGSEALQRPLAPGRWHRFLKILQSGGWRLNEITFHHVTNPGPDGKAVYLSNGQHRLMAVSHHTEAAPFIVIHRYVDSMEEVVLDYECYDSVFSTRKLTDVLNASGLIHETGLTRNNIRVISSGVRFIAAGFKRPSFGDESISLLATHPAMIAAIREWAPEATAYLGSLYGCSQHIRHPLSRMSVVAVALVTYRHQRELADRFWGRIAEMSGLEKLEPEHTVMKFLLERTHKGTGVPAWESRSVAAGWNAFFEERKIALLKALDVTTPIRIAGTPYKG